MQVPYSDGTQIQKKGNIQSAEKRFAGNHKNIMQIQRSRNNRRSYDAGPRSFITEYSTENKCIKFYGIS